MLHYSVVPPYSGGYSAYTPSSSSSYLPSRYAISSRPIRIDTADIDVFRARPIRVPYTSPQGTIHRGRSVVRLQTSRYHTPRSPGARLVEKFRIKDPVISTASVLPVGEPANTSDAINRVSVCQVNQLSVPVVISREKYEVSEETVVFPLKKTIVNCREVTVSLKQPKTSYTSTSYSADVETSINITLNSNGHLQTSGRNERTPVDDLERSSDFIYRTNNSQQSGTIIKESGQREPVFDNVPIIHIPTELGSTTAICNYKQETQASDTLITQESNRNSDQQIGKPESSPEIDVERSTCLLSNGSRGKVHKKKVKEREKIGAKEGKKLKITKLNVALTDDIKSDAKIESKGQPTINTSGVTVIPDDLSNKPKTLESISLQQGQSELTIKRDYNSELLVSSVSPTDQLIKESNTYLEESREISNKAYTKGQNNKVSTADKTIRQKDSSNSFVVNEKESLSRSLNETNIHSNISDKFRQKDSLGFDEESNKSFLLEKKKVKENITKESESVLSGKRRRKESIVKVDGVSLIESFLDNKVITKTETYTAELAGKDSSLYSTLENQGINKAENKGKSPLAAVPVDKRDSSSKPDDKAKESAGSKDSLPQIASKVETKAKSSPAATPTNKRDGSPKADDKAKKSAGGKDLLTQVASKVETKAKSPPSATPTIKQAGSPKANDIVKESAGGKDSLTEVASKVETKAKSLSAAVPANKRDGSPKPDDKAKESAGSKDSLPQVASKVETKAKSPPAGTPTIKRAGSPKANDIVKESAGGKGLLTQVASKVETKAKSLSAATPTIKRAGSPKADTAKESAGGKDSLTQVASKVETKAKLAPATVPANKGDASPQADDKGKLPAVCKDTFTYTSLRNKGESKAETKTKSPPAAVPEKRESSSGASDKAEESTGYDSLTPICLRSRADSKAETKAKSLPPAVNKVTLSTVESSLKEESNQNRTVNNLQQFSLTKISGNASSNNESSIKDRNSNLNNRSESCDSDNNLEISEGNFVNGDILVGNNERNGNLASDHRNNEVVVNSFGPKSEIVGQNIEIVGQPSDRSTVNDKKAIISCKVSEGECTVDTDCNKSTEEIAFIRPVLVKIDSKVYNHKLGNSTENNKLSDSKISDSDNKQCSLISYDYKKSNSICEEKPELNKQASKTKKNKQLVKTKKSTSTGAIKKKVSSSGKGGKVKSLVKKKTTSIKEEPKVQPANDDDFEDEGLGKDYCSVKTSDGSTSLDSDWEQVEIEEMEDGVPKKKLIVRKKGSQVSVTPLLLKPPAIVEDEAKTGQITRQLSKKRVSLVDEDLGFLEDRKMSITDEMIVEEAAVLDSMIHQELAASERRKSSLGLSAQEVAQSEASKAAPTLQDNRREIWKNKLRTSGKSLGKFYKPVIEETTSSSEDEEGSSDSESTESGSDVAGACSGRLSPPAKSLPRFRTYSIKDFQFLKVLGKGSFGKVLLAELKGSECYYAVKCLKKDVVLEDDDVECTMIERKVLALGTTHPYFCHLFCTFQTQSHLFFVMEYLNGGDLMFHIQQSGRFDEGRARFYAAEIVSALTFLHKWGIVYRDLKLDNVLLDFDGHVRIADFGMCKLQIYLDKTTDTFCGTPDYMAPEIIKGLKYNQCVDWWSFGILLYEMLVGQSPFSGCDEDDLFWSICNMRPHFPRYLSAEAKSILNAFLEKDWTKRLGSSENGASEVMNHEFFIGLKWHLLERRQLEPPFKPHMKHPLDTKYFDRAFTSEKPVLTPVDKSILESMDQTQFQGFSYTNPNATE